MSNSDKTGWPGGLGFPFLPLPLPGAARPAQDAAPASALTSGMGLLTSLWSQLPGSAQVPAFLMPTVDLEELDKRIGDLRAAESWVEVNLNLLRSTIQGLEVQRNTIAALHALSMPQAAAPASPARPVAVAEPASAAPPVVPPAAAAAATEPKTPQAGAEAKTSPVGAEAKTPPVGAVDWLGYLQDQFAKVAQAALTATQVPDPAKAPAPGRPTAGKAPAAKRAASRRRKAG